MAASSLEQKLSRLEAKLKQENREARRRIDLNLDISPQRPRPSKHGGVGEGAGGGGARSAGGPAHVPRPRLPFRSALASPRRSPQLSARVERVTVTPRLGAGGLPDGAPPLGECTFLGPERLVTRLQVMLPHLMTCPHHRDLRSLRHLL